MFLGIAHAPRSQRREVEAARVPVARVLPVAVDLHAEGVAAGQAVVAVVKPLQETFDSAALLTHCKRQLPNFMVPLHIATRSADLPRNPNGKIDRKSLAAELATLFQDTAP